MTKLSFTQNNLVPVYYSEKKLVLSIGENSISESVLNFLLKNKLTIDNIDLYQGYGYEKDIIKTIGDKEPVSVQLYDINKLNKEQYGVVSSILGIEEKFLPENTLVAKIPQADENKDTPRYIIVICYEDINYDIFDIHHIERKNG